MTATNDLDRMIHPQEALETILAHARPLGTESVPIGDAAWRVLADDLVAPEDHPPFAASTMDGYAVVAIDGSPWREVLGVQKAGAVLDVEVTDGMAVKIMTGAPIPPGADAVVQVENTETADDHVIIHQDDVPVGLNIRPIGVDVKKGDLILAAGTRLGPSELGMVAAMGLNPVPVYKRARISILSTGDELVEPGDPVGPGQIRDSNRFSLMAAIEAEGGEIVWSGKTPDERPGLEQLLQERIADSDIVITSGGVSMGDLDLVKALLVELATVHFRRIFFKPGKPLNFATSGNALIFGLPGNPVSALTTFELFLRPALAVLNGRGPCPRALVPVVLDQRAIPADRIEYQRARVSVAPDGTLHAAPNGSQASSRLASFVGVNALLVIAPREFDYEAGERVQAMMLAAPFASA
jgi:gephyrin